MSVTCFSRPRLQGGRYHIWSVENPVDLAVDNHVNNLMLVGLIVSSNGLVRPGCAGPSLCGPRDSPLQSHASVDSVHALEWVTTFGSVCTSRWRGHVCGRRSGHMIALCLMRSRIAWVRCLRCPNSAGGWLLDSLRNGDGGDLSKWFPTVHVPQVWEARTLDSRQRFYRKRPPTTLAAEKDVSRIVPSWVHED